MMEENRSNRDKMRGQRDLYVKCGCGKLRAHHTPKEARECQAKGN